MSSRPFPVRLLEIVGVCGALLYAGSAIWDGEGGISLALMFAISLVSVGLILLITTKRSGTAWVAEAVLSILWIPYWLFVVGRDAISYGASAVFQALGPIGFVSLAISVATLALLANKDVRRWKV